MTKNGLKSLRTRLHKCSSQSEACRSLTPQSFDL